ncbi:MAG: ABC transporter substrate-binding protein [Candidatus Paracaedibacteraceae bacterium]|nr:ABC transporter substrate-binding protein [Candidatus Paracaedibacteraceae bacterium]
MKIKIYLSLALLTIISIFAWQKYLAPTQKTDLSKKITTIGIIQFIEHPALDQTRQGILDSLKENGYIDNKNARIHFESAQGNSGLSAQIIQKFVGQKVDIIVAIGTTTAQAAKQATVESKTPVVFASVTDPVGAKLVDSMAVPGKNVTGVSNYISISKQFSFFKRILAHLKNIGVVYNPGEQNSVVMIDKMKEVADVFDLGIHTSPATKTSEVMSASQSLIHKSEAIFINNDSTALSAIDAVIKVGNERDIPVFVSDIDVLNKGALAALGPNQYELGKQAGIMIQRILSGESPSKMTVELPKKVFAKVNVAVSARLQIPYQSEKFESFGD